jgi:serine-type D-Ala-D-Ala carboxypeptidase/endopeptidase (penicillin-binding protein 4)
MSRGVMTLRVNSSGGPMDPQQTISISGQIPARSQRTYSIAIRNVPMAMAAVLKLHLQRDGISVTGQPRVDRAPANRVLETLAEKKTNLVDLLEYMNKRSDNYLAESMFRKLSTIAQVAATAPDERARTLMRSWLQVCDVNGSACTFIDGSGLSKEDRVTANTVIDLLVAIKQRGMFPLFTHTLSVAGYDGTLRHRMIGTAAQYNAHGKTGTLNFVTVLGGYVLTGDGQLAAYFITMQNFRGGPWTYKREQDKVVEALANFKYADYQSADTSQQ